MVARDFIYTDSNKKYSVRLVRPCVEDPNKYIAESNFERAFSMKILCSILRELGVADLKCSEGLGVARFKLLDKSIMLYRRGRIDIRRVKSEQDAIETIENVKKMIKDAFN
ncbi:MAG: hypothetical protein ACE5J9_00025 [Methanosarcinales archaeon]